MQRESGRASWGGSKDGHGAADHDAPYQFGRRPRATTPWPFSERQYGRLLALRGRVLDDEFADDCQAAGEAGSG